MQKLRTATRLKLGYAALAVADTLLAGSSRPLAHRARVLTKPLLMPTLAAALATDPRGAASPLRNTTLLAQLGGWGGDLALMRPGTTMFAAGAGSFAVGHAAYLTGFRRHRAVGTRLADATAPRAIAAVWAASAPILAIGAYRQEPVLGPAVAGYSGILALMAVTATRLDPAMPAAARRATALGAGLFLVSDSVLAVRKFLLPDPPARLESVVMATYTAAQFLLSEGASRAGRRT